MKRACVESLAAALRAVLPPTVDVAACAADWEEPTKFPAVRVLPGKFTFEPFQEQEVDDSQSDKLFLDVGEFEGTVEVRVSGRSRTQREHVEDIVSNWLLAREWTPGVQTTTLPQGVLVGGFATTYQAACAFAVDDDEWREEMAFSDKRFSYVELTTSFPALVCRTSVYTIQDLVLVMAADVSEDVGSSPSPSAEERVLVAQDGSMSRTNE